MLSTVVILATLALLSDAAFPRPRPVEPEAPAVPNSPKLSPNGPKINPDRIGDGVDLLSNAVPSQDDIELKMGDAEVELQGSQNLTASASPTGAFLDVIVIVSAILAKPDCVRSGDGVTRTGAGALTSTACSDPAFTPTATAPSTSFAACTSFASIISACNSATDFFYNLQPSAQASCVCYRPTSVELSCTDSVAETLTETATARLNTSRFDDQAKSCQQYFSAQGYKGLAQGLSGKHGDAAVLGADFCADVDSELRSKGNGSVGLLPGLETEWQKPCGGYVPAKTTSGAERLLFTNLNPAIMFTVLLFTSAVLSLLLS